MLAVVFPGQGSQQIGMGTPWREHASWSVVERAAAVTGLPIDELLVVDRGPDTFPSTREAQLAVLVQSLMVWDAIAPHLPDPALMAGHSLGQITALIASGALEFDAGLQLAVARADATATAAAATPGAMAALLGGDLDVAHAAVAPADEAWVANDNGAGQIVIGGTPAGVAAASERAKALGVRKVMPLAVAGAFHTPLMAPAAAALAPVFTATRFRSPAVPVVSNHDAETYADDAWAGRLADHLVHPVRWGPTMQAMAAAGVTHLVEVGPGSTLGALARRAWPAVNVCSAGRPEDIRSVLEVSFS